MFYLESLAAFEAFFSWWSSLALVTVLSRFPNRSRGSRQPCNHPHMSHVT